VAPHINMKIYSWNMLFRNQKLDRAFDFIAQSDFDIFCMQEVPSTFLDRLQELPCHLTYRIDVERLLPGGTLPNFVVILSKYPIEDEGNVPFPDYWHQLPVRTRLFVSLMKPFGLSHIKNRGGHFADVRIGEKLVRVFNLHLILAHPTWRLREFEAAMLHHDPSRPTIVCGDFNILESRHITIANWLLGGPAWDAVLSRRERTVIEQRFVAHELTNALAGNVTHPISQSQLDHILLSKSFSVKKAEVLKDRVGSDHCPIYIETT